MSNTFLPVSSFPISLLAILNTSSEFAIAMFFTLTSFIYSGNVNWNLGFLYKSFSSLELFNLTSNLISLLSAIVLNVFLEIASSAFVSVFSNSILFSISETLLSAFSAYNILPVYFSFIFENVFICSYEYSVLIISFSV